MSGRRSPGWKPRRRRWAHEWHNNRADRRGNKPLTFCDECGSTIRLVGGPGRMFEVRRGVELAIPPACRTYHCRACGNSYSSPEDTARVYRALGMRAALFLEDEA